MKGFPYLEVLTPIKYECNVFSTKGSLSCVKATVHNIDFKDQRINRLYPKETKTTEVNIKCLLKWGFYSLLFLTVKLAKYSPFASSIFNPD